MLFIATSYHATEYFIVSCIQYCNLIIWVPFYCLTNSYRPNSKMTSVSYKHDKVKTPHTEKTGQLPTSLPMGCTWATEWAARGLPMGILPCKLGCPLLPYMETVGSSVSSPLLQNIKKVGSSVGSGVGCPWAAHGTFAMQIRLPTTSIYGNSGQLSGQPTTSKHEKSGQLSGQWSGLPMCCPLEFCHAN